VSERVLGVFVDAFTDYLMSTLHQSCWTRRHFLGAMAATAAVGSLVPVRAGTRERGEAAALPAGAAALLARLQMPEIPSRNYRVEDFGAIGDGTTDARPGFLSALRRCHEDGGGRVIVPAGVWWLEGPLHLRSHTCLHLEQGAVLRFRTDDPRLYLPLVLTRWEGTELFNYSPFIYAYQAKDVALTGKGTIDGNSLTTFVAWRPQQRPAQMRLRGLGGSGAPVHERVFGDGQWLRPSFVQFFGCTRVLVEDVTLRDSPFWCLHAIACHNVVVRRLTVRSAPINSDGFDAESCSDVLVEDCDFDVGDDCVALKSGRDADGWRLGRPTEDVLIRRCRFNAPLAGSGLALGSEMSGGIRRVWVEDVEMGYAKTALNFKGNLDRGGVVEDIQVRRVRVHQADAFLLFTTDYHGYRGGNHPPRFRRFLLEDLSCKQALRPLGIVGVERANIEDVTLRRIAVDRAAEPPQIRHVRRLELSDVTVNQQPVQVPSEAKSSE
jgi:polygalacturonase